jgi:glycosyltransferase involved in cell wall biosynthesis
VIGPLPLPVNGCSYANEVLLKNLERRNISYAAINTNTDIISGRQGSRFSIRKALSFTKTYLEVYKIFSASVVYLTPGQTFFGVCKYAPFLLFCKLLRKPYIIHLHGNYLGTEYKSLRGIKKNIFRYFIAGASAAIVLSKALCRNFENLLPPDKVHIVENFVDESLFLLPLKKNTNELRILYLSNLMLEKGILELLDGLAKLQQKAVTFHLTIAGAMETGIKEAVNKRMATLGEQITYLGTVTGEAKKKALTEANVFVLPTYYKMEGQPICLLEGMATGNIIVTTAHAGIPDVIDQSNGFFIRPESPAAVARCVEKIGRDLPAMMTLFSEHNRTYAAAKFTEKNFTEKILNIINSVAKA